MLAPPFLPRIRRGPGASPGTGAAPARRSRRVNGGRLQNGGVAGVITGLGSLRALRPGVGGEALPRTMPLWRGAGWD